MEAVREKRTKTRRPKRETEVAKADLQCPEDVQVKSIPEEISTTPEVNANSDAECGSLSPELVMKSTLEPDNVPQEETEKEDEKANIPSAPCSMEETPPIMYPVPPEELNRRPDLSEFQCTNSNTEEYRINQAPSAPELCDLDFYQIQQINRGILDEIQQMQTRSFLQPIILQEPYSAVERNQLYFNPKLETVLSFESNGKKYFTDHSDQMARSQLFAELEAYYNLQRDLHNLKVDVSQLKESFPKIRKRIWCVQHTTAHFSRKCSTCPSEYPHNVAIRHLTGNYSENWAVSFKESLTNYADISCNVFRGKIILRDIQMLNISTIIQEIIDHSKETPRRDELRVTLTTLFHFVVKKTATKDFRENIKDWLGRILVVFNECSLLEDKLFLMSHVLRCPTEAALLVSRAVNIAPPGREVNADLINEWLAVLWMCLRPVRHWNKKSQEESTEHDANWSIVDSEGEDAEEDGGDWKYPNETVLLDILDRIPFGRTFEAWLATNELGNSIYVVNLLRLIMFSSAFVTLVSEGPATYQQDRYKTFLKRLAGIVKWSADLVTGAYDLYRSGDQPRDNAMMERLATEYNFFIVRVCESLTKNKAMLQYLSQLHFANLEVNSFWKLALYLLTSFPRDLSQDFNCDFRRRANSEFNLSSSECTISQWSSEELYFILETISSLAISCGDRDPQFTEWVVQKLCQVGFVLEDVRDKCYKSVRDLLMTVTSNSPLAIEMILREIQLNLAMISDQALYMLKALPYDDWRPSMDTVDVIADMLENYALDSVQQNIGKLLVSYMNWGYADEAGGQGLVLGHEYHCRVAMVVLSATSKKFPRPESYKRISLAGIDANPEKRYIAWAWKMVTKLKLHSMDQGAVAKLQKMENNSIKVIPLLRTEFVPTMQRLVQVEKNPLATYLSLLMCDVGNVTGEVLSQGLTLIVQTMENMPLVIVLRCLELLVPLFLNSTDDLIKSEDLAQIVDSLLEERSLLSLQLTWRASEVVGQFAEMVVNQILEFSGYGWESVQRISWIWMMILTRNANWYSNNNCLYILERMLQMAATIPGILDAFRDHVYPLSLELKLRQKTRKSLITKNVVSFPWCSLLFLELEFNCYEQVTNDWLKLVDRMSGEEKRSVNQIVKELTDVYSASELTVFKWADFLCKLDVESSVFSVALVQYWRLIKHCPQLDTQNPGLITKLETKLNAAAKSFTKSALDEEDAGLKRVYQSLSSLLTSVAEKRHGTLENSIDSRNAFVLDYIHMPSLRSEMRKLAESWKLISFRQEIKRRGTPLKSRRGLSEVPMKEKRLRIFEMLKQQKECDSFVVLTEEFDIKELLLEAGRQKDFTRFIDDIWKEYLNVMHSVDRQKQLEFQLYIEKLITYDKTFHCKSCLRTIHVPVRYKELVKSSENGDQNMEFILSYDVNEGSKRDNALVKYFFGLQYNMRICVSKCQDGDHSQCHSLLQRSLDICQRFDEKTVLKFGFVSEILNKLKEKFKLLYRRHSSTQAHQIVKVIFRNPVMAPLLMDVLDPDQLDDGSYLRLLRNIFDEGRNGEKALGVCFQKMKVGDRASRLGITESFRLSIIRFVFEYLPSFRNEMFDLLAKEIYTVMLRHITLMPEVIKLTFSQRSKTDLLNVLLQILDLAGGDPQELFADDFERRVERVAHVFTFAVIEWTVNFMNTSVLLNSTVNGRVLTHFFRLLSILLIDLNTALGPASVHSMIALMYHKQIQNRPPESANWFTESYFKVLKFVPSGEYLGHQLQFYLGNFSLLDDKTLAIEKHKFYASSMHDLSWDKFSPSAEDVSEIYRRLSLQNKMSENRNNSSVSQRVVCNIIVKINWPVVREERLQNEFADPQFLARLFFIALRVPYELPESKADILQFYESLEKLPWHWVREQNYEEALNWIVQSYPQMPFVAKLSLDKLSLDQENTVENGMMSLLFMAARVYESQRGHYANIRDPVSDSKKRRLTGAMVRVFAINAGCETRKLQTGFGTYLETMRIHFSQLDSADTAELEFFQGELLKLLDDKALSWPYLTVLNNEIADDELFIECFLRTLANVDVVTKSRAKFFECLLSNYFRKCTNNSHPWQSIEGLCFPFVVKLRLDHLKDLELYLSLHLYTTCKLKMCDNTKQRIDFIQELINWLPNIQFTDQNEVFLLLLWSQVVCLGAEIYLKDGSSGIIEKCQKYLKSSSVLRTEGWGKSIFNAIGLAKMQKQELCIRYIIYSLITCFTELRESSTESSVKFVQQFEADTKSSKIGHFKAQLDDLFGSGQSMVTSSRENYSATLIQFIRLIYATGCTDWFKNVHDFWRGSI